MMRPQRQGLLVALYASLVVGGLLLGRHVVALPDLAGDPGGEAQLSRIIAMAVVVYIALAALPFVPAAEIGLGLMLMFGPEIAVLVYLSTVFALVPGYLIGRTIPAGACAAAFGYFGLDKARNLVLEMAALDATARLELLLARAPARIAPGLIRRRYLALAIALNLPGNSLAGGGGGIALSAGMSGLYPMPAYLVTVAVAVAPVPLLFALSPWLR